MPKRFEALFVGGNHPSIAAFAATDGARLESMRRLVRTGIHDQLKDRTHESSKRGDPLLDTRILAHKQTLDKIQRAYAAYSSLRKCRAGPHG